MERVGSLSGKGRDFALFTDLSDKVLSEIDTGSARVHRGLNGDLSRMDGGFFLFHDHDICLRTLAQWRTSPGTSLLPAICGISNNGRSGNGISNNVLIEQLADSAQDLLSFPGTNISLLTSEINDRVDALNVSNKTLELPRARLISFLTSRRKQAISPSKSLTSNFGFSWPKAHAFMSDISEGKELTVLQDMVREGLLRADTVDVVHGCPKCMNSRIGAAKACPDCGSTVISKTNVIHHYSCGGVFPEVDGWTEEGLRCTKCHRPLLHIGVDYDRPVSVDYCSTCGRSDEIFEYLAHCFSCEEKFTLKDAEQISIDNYHLDVDDDAVIAYLKTIDPDNILKQRYSEPQEFDQTLSSRKATLRRRADTFTTLTMRLNASLGHARQTDLVKDLVFALRDTDKVSRD